jgi:hypothetical protein
MRFFSSFAAAGGSSAFCVSVNRGAGPCVLPALLRPAAALGGAGADKTVRRARQICDWPGLLQQDCLQSPPVHRCPGSCLPYICRIRPFLGRALAQKLLIQLASPTGFEPVLPP